MSRSSSSPADNVAEGLYSDKCTDRKSCPEHVSSKDELLIFCCLHCSKSHEKEFNKDLMNTYEFCDGDINKFCLMLRKGLYI